MLTKEILTWDALSIGDRLGTFRAPFVEATVREFAEIADPESLIYSDVAPALAYDTLHAVKHFIELPQGTVHSKEAVEFQGLITPDSDCTIEVSVADVGVRRGKRNMCIRYEVRSGTTNAMTVYKTFVLPGKVDRKDTEPPVIGDFDLFNEAASGNHVPGVTLAIRQWEVTQDLLNEFGRVTATDGPIHTDHEVAAPLFGGTILQGMYLFETASQMMTTLSSPREWLESGQLAAKIVGSSITGESVTMTAKLSTVTLASSPTAQCQFEAVTDNGRTVFIAQARGPLTAVEFVQEIRS